MKGDLKIKKKNKVAFPLIYFNEYIPEISHNFSDKLAMRQLVGVQGSVLFSLSQPVYLSQYLVNRSFNEAAFNRAVYQRVKGLYDNRK